MQTYISGCSLAYCTSLRVWSREAGIYMNMKLPRSTQAWACNQPGRLWAHRSLKDRADDKNGNWPIHTCSTKSHDTHEFMFECAVCDLPGHLTQWSDSSATIDTTKLWPSWCFQGSARRVCSWRYSQCQPLLSCISCIIFLRKPGTPQTRLRDKHYRKLRVWLVQEDPSCLMSTSLPHRHTDHRPGNSYFVFEAAGKILQRSVRTMGLAGLAGRGGLVSGMVFDRNLS